MIEFIKEIALQAGKICLEHTGKLSANELHFKTPKDIVTDVDREVEEYIISRINKSFPDHSIHGEESGENTHNSAFKWVVDPIDGTTSFVHSLPFYSVSIALQYHNETIAGVVYAPKLDELFAAEKGRGATLNDKAVTVSCRQRLIDSLLGTGFACLRADLAENNLPHFNRIMPKIRGIRRMGSAALDLCYVACGRLDGFWELNLNSYDFAAGEFIVREAGGIVSDFHGGVDYENKGIVATNQLIAGELIELLNC